MNFFDFIQRAQQTNQPEWNYYRTDIPIDPLLTPERSSEFIRAYFQNGQKGFAVAELEENLQWMSSCGPRRNHDPFTRPVDVPKFVHPLHLSEYRAVHIVSAFFLGIYLESCLTRAEPGVDIQIGDRFFPFSYLWFLTCVYHDYGYIVEENRQPPNFLRPPSRTREGYLGGDGRHQLARIKQDLNITIPFYPHRIVQPRAVRNGFRGNYAPSKFNCLLKQAPSLQAGLTFDCGATITNLTYSKTMLERYFSYGIHELKKPIYNHGIIGGYLFYDRMLKSYLSAYENLQPCISDRENPYPGLGEFIWNGKSFSAGQIPLFAHIADCIIAHNVWKADEASENKYVEYGLKRLVGGNFEKISFQKNPLLFILTVVDTLEPYKVYGRPSERGKDAARVWRSINVTFHDGRLMMRSRYKCRPIHWLYEKAKELKAWVDIVDIALLDDGKILSVKIIP